MSKRKIIDETHADEGHRSRAKKQISKKTSDHGQVHPRGANTHVVETAVAVYVFGDGENAELGLGPKRTESLIPRRNPFLDPTDPSKFHVIQVACGGMHTVALTVDNKIITWGVNDNGALGRPTEWDGGLRDIDIDSDDEEEELNPLESTPSQVLTVSFGRHTQFIQVAAGDNCTFALSSEGEVYGWGTFRVCGSCLRFCSVLNGMLIRVTVSGSQGKSAFRIQFRG